MAEDPLGVVARTIEKPIDEVQVTRSADDCDGVMIYRPCFCACFSRLNDQIVCFWSWCEQASEKMNWIQTVAVMRLWRTPCPRWMSVGTAIEIDYDGAAFYVSSANFC